MNTPEETPASPAEKNFYGKSKVPWKARILGWLRDLMLLLVVLAGVSWWSSRGLVGRGEPMPEFSLATIDHRVISNETLQGKPTAMVLWAPWCGVCGAESSNVSRLQRWAGERANVVSVAIGYRDYAAVTDFVQKHSVDYPVLLSDGVIEETLNVDRLPTIYFFDAEGRVRFSTSGYTTTLGLLVRMWLS